MIILRTSTLNATLINSFLVRFLDFNDMGGGSHNSDVIPSIIVFGEREKSSGRDVLISIVVLYEFGARIAAFLPKLKISSDEKSWSSDTRACLIMSPSLRKLGGERGSDSECYRDLCMSRHLTRHSRCT